MKNNVIPRKFNRIIAKQLKETSGGIPGNIWIVTKDIYNRYIGYNTATGKHWALFVSHLRMPEFFEFLAVEK